MNNHSDRIRLPTALQSAGDPVQGNPFSADNPGHSVWSRATREAEQEACGLRLTFAKARFENLPALIAGMIDFATAQYDIWAKRGVHVVWNERDVRAYDQWLHRNAESWLGVAAEWCPDTVRAESLLGELQLRLIERLEWWKLEARRYMAEQEAHRARARSTSEAVESALERQAKSWEDIEISFISEERVQISIGTSRETRNYEEMGFGNKKNGTPVLAWATLRELAEAGGGIKVAADPRKWAEIEKRIQEIRKQLRGLFGLSGDPLPYHSKSKNAAEFGYLARFKIGCGRSYNH